MLSSLTVHFCSVTLDTVANRKAMPNADFSQWTPLDHLAVKLYSWSADVDRPPTSSLMQVVTVDGETDISPIN